MTEKIKIGFYFSRAAHKRLKGLAERDHRSMSGEVAWLIEQEWQQYRAHLPSFRSPGRGNEPRSEETSPTGQIRTEDVT